MKTYQRLEIAGMFLILIAFAWQFFIDRQHDNMLTDWQFEHIEKRLDEIHQRQSELQKNQNILAEQLANNEKPWAKFVDDFKYTTVHEGASKELKDRSESFKLLGVTVFLFGSALLLIGKFLEYNEGNA